MRPKKFRCWQQMTDGPSTAEQEQIAAFCRAEHQLKSGKCALAQHKKPLLAVKRQTLEQLTAQLTALAVDGVNIRVDQTCWKVRRKQQATKQAVTPRLVQGLGAVPAAATLEELGDWVWAELQTARTTVRSVLDLHASKVDLCTQLPPEARLEGGSAAEREEASDTCREALQAVLTEHCHAKAELATLQQSYNTQCQELRKESTAAHTGVLAYMERAQVELQPIRLGEEQFAMRRRAMSRCRPLTRQADIKSWIQETLQQLVPGVSADQPLTPEQQAACTAELTTRLVQGLPRREGVSVSLIAQR
jgi:hypothetical protein